MEFDWRYPRVFDPDAEIRDWLGYLGQPVTIIFDRQERMAFEWSGPLTGVILRREIMKIVPSGKP